MNEVQKERLRYLEKILRKIGDKQEFDLVPRKHVHFDMADFGSKIDCGTAACAAGVAGLHPWFRRRGFKMAPGDGVRYEDKEGNEYEGMSACYHFFGTSYPFDPGFAYYIGLGIGSSRLTPVDAADAIRFCVEKYF